ncbi:hypothetical protein FGG08_006303 [Glutinoglossum americanum]|uniref:Uncharacterized protein n=1 Tax=Glutinoglossum americanum TaxID=1670608 RepID=A0A9P8L106_9PEZI|nr:hypothetical protein FGG08_006303 [Glutinoglossum americanum]
MPHKHRRSKASREDNSQFELPPSTLAKPLTATKSDSKSRSKSTNTLTTTDRKKTKSIAKRKAKKSGEDDTPKAFSRLLQFQKTGRYPSGLDDGTTKPFASKKRKRDNTDSKTTPTANQAPSGTPAAPPILPIPTILPNEPLSHFSARVDAALPVSGLITKHPSRARSDPVPGLKVRKTKLERRMQKMYAEWRVADARIKEQRAAALEEAEDDDDEVGYNDGLSSALTKKKRKSKRVRRNNASASDDEDPWAHLRATRNEPIHRSLHDVVQAPPQLTHLPKQKLKSGALLDGVPKAAGSLRRREELGGLRRGVVEGYRALMERRREAGEGG